MLFFVVCNCRSHYPSFPPSVLYVDWTTASKNFSPFILFHFHAFSEKVRPITGGVMRFAVLRFLANFCLVFPVLQSSFSHWYYFIKNFKIHTDQNPSKINADILPVKTVGHIKINESISFPRFLMLQCSLFHQFLLARGVYNLFIGWSATICSKNNFISLGDTKPNSRLTGETWEKYRLTQDKY